MNPQKNAGVRQRVAGRIFGAVLAALQAVIFTHKAQETATHTTICRRIWSFMYGNEQAKFYF